MKKLTSLSVFFPCFNEAANLPVLIDAASQVIPELAKEYELIIVNDGSTDQTKQVAARLIKKYDRVRLVNHDENKGYGAALQTGFKQSQYDWIFYTDGDNQFDISELANFLPFTDKHQAIIGYRKKRVEGFKREIYAIMLKFFVDLVFRLHVKDIDCAFKLLKADLVKDLDLLSSGGFISSEFLYRLKKKGLEFKQLPVTHLPRKHGQSTGSNFKVLVRAGLDALSLYLKIKFNL